ncbi:MAG: peptidase inhibitor family I36 protein, partial [Thermoanaerobaculia bacterium]
MRQSVVLVHRKILLVSCLAICLASTANAQYENQPGGVTLYRDLGFSGTSQTFSDDVTDLRGSYVGNDSVTSVRISSGCRARLYADADYRGSYLE